MSVLRSVPLLSIHARLRCVALVRRRCVALVRHRHVMCAPITTTAGPITARSECCRPGRRRMRTACIRIATLRCRATARPGIEWSFEITVNKPERGSFLLSVSVRRGAELSYWAKIGKN